MLDYIVAYAVSPDPRRFPTDFKLDEDPVHVAELYNRAACGNADELYFARGGRNKSPSLRLMKMSKDDLAGMAKRYPDPDVLAFIHAAEFYCAAGMEIIIRFRR